MQDFIRINIVLDRRLVEKGLKATGFHTCKELVDYAIRELLRRKNQAQILKLKGKIDWKGDLKKSRQNRVF